MDNLSRSNTYMETVRVRVFVAVNGCGEWLAAGGDSLSVSASQTRCEYDEAYDAGYWIEANLPLPNQAPEIVATVTRA